MKKHIKLWSFADVDRSGKVRWTARESGYEIEEMKSRLAGFLTAWRFNQTLSAYAVHPSRDKNQ